MADSLPSYLAATDLFVRRHVGPRQRDLEPMLGSVAPPASMR
jgi:hypothetical protein